jgi:hypothetical protein
MKALLMLVLLLSLFLLALLPLLVDRLFKLHCCWIAMAQDAF